MKWDLATVMNERAELRMRFKRSNSGRGRIKWGISDEMGGRGMMGFSRCHQSQHIKQWMSSKKRRIRSDVAKFAAAEAGVGKHGPVLGLARSTSTVASSAFCNTFSVCLSMIGQNWTCWCCSAVEICWNFSFLRYQISTGRCCHTRLIDDRLHESRVFDQIVLHQDCVSSRDIRNGIT